MVCFPPLVKCIFETVDTVDIQLASLFFIKELKEPCDFMSVV